MAQMYNHYLSLIVELSDAINFMQTFDDEPSWIGCICDAEEENQCSCINEKGEHERIIQKEKICSDALAHLERFRLFLKDSYENGKSDNSFRICSKCENVMTEGYFIGVFIENGKTFFCSKDCMNEHLTNEEYQELYDDGKAEYFWISLQTPSNEANLKDYFTLNHCQKV